VAFDYNEEYRTMCFRLDEPSIVLLNELNRNLEILGLPLVKMTIHEVFGNQIYIKCKKNQKYTKAERGQIMNNLETTLSVFTNKKGQCFASLSV